MGNQEHDTLRQAFEDAIRLRAKAALEPCLRCETHPALLCADHAPELDWVAVYRALARDLGIELAPACQELPGSVVSCQPDP